MLEKLAERFGAAPTIACVIVFGILLSLVVILLMSKLEYFLKRIWRSEITVGARSIRLCSVPLTGLVAVSPAAAFFLSKSGYPDLFIFLSLLLPIALTIIWSVFTCGMRGVWVGVVRILLGNSDFRCPLIGFISADNLFRSVQNFRKLVLRQFSFPPNGFQFISKGCHSQSSLLL